MVRGERVDVPLVFPLRHEMVFQSLLEDNGIPVPHVYGWIEELPAYVMTRVPGRPDFAPGTSTAERDQVVKEYMALLARIHRLDPEQFSAAGITRAERPELSAAAGTGAFETLYRETKKRPEPFMEFALGWLRRHPLPPHEREAPIVWDSGQYHHVDGHCNAVIDVEIGYVGDPMMDLAAFRMRDTVLHFGDFTQMYQWYVDAGGFPLDMAAVQWHHVFFTLSNQLSFGSALADPPPGSDYMTNLQWCSETNRHAVEALAECMDVTLPEVEIPVAGPISAAGIAHAHQVRTLRSVRTDDEFLAYELRGAFRLARHLQRVEEIGTEVDAADLDDLAKLLGERPASAVEGDKALEDFVLADDGVHDEELVHLFHRRLSRQHALLGPAGSAMATHHVCTPFVKV
ncbi:MAG: putative protein kinase, partial [Frankiales bacterium]|nr:putative protein kinase [Frankiales bacterium]